MDVSGSMGSGKKGKAASGYRVLTHEDLAAQQAGLVAEVCRKCVGMWEGGGVGGGERWMKSLAMCV